MKVIGILQDTIMVEGPEKSQITITNVSKQHFRTILHICKLVEYKFPLVAKIKGSNAA